MKPSEETRAMIERYRADVQAIRGRYYTPKTIGTQQRYQVNEAISALGTAIVYLDQIATQEETREAQRDTAEEANPIHPTE